jgi:hypothetical protein
MPVLLALLMLLGPLGHVIPSTDSGGREGQDEGSDSTFDDLTPAQKHALGDSPVLSHASGRNAEQIDDGMGWGWAVKAGGLRDVPGGGHGIAVDSSGNAYVTGYFAGTVNFVSNYLSSNGYDDIFVAKLSSSGVWQWAVKAGGSNYDYGEGIAVDSSGNVYVTGGFGGTATFGSTSLTSSEYRDDIFVAKLSNIGAWQWAVKAGGSSDDRGRGIAVDSSGNAYVTGYFAETATFGSTNLTSSGDVDIFVAELSSSGAWKWAVKAGGSSSDFGHGIAVDSSGNAYVTGFFEGTASFGSTSLSSNGNEDIFVAKLSSSGAWQWVRKAGSSSGDFAHGIAVDSSGNAYVTGSFQATVIFGSTSLTTSGGYDIFVAKLSSNGAWLWAVKAGGSYYDSGDGIAVDSSGNAYITGYFDGTATFGSTSLSSGNADIFVAELSSSGAWKWAVKAGGSSDDRGRGIAVDSSGNAYVTGYFAETATFGSTSLTSSEYRDDIFIAQLSPDSDGDGVPDSSDQCEGHDDSTDVDADGTPDGCDSFIDSDGDGVPDSSDQCEGHDDSADMDAGDWVDYDCRYPEMQGEYSISILPMVLFASGMLVTICFLVGMVLVIRRRKHMVSMRDENDDGIFPRTSEFAAPSPTFAAPPEEQTPTSTAFVAPTSQMTCARCKCGISAGEQVHCDYCGTPYHPSHSIEGNDQCIVCDEYFR